MYASNLKDIIIRMSKEKSSNSLDFKISVPGWILLPEFFAVVGTSKWFPLRSFFLLEGVELLLGGERQQGLEVGSTRIFATAGTIATGVRTVASRISAAGFLAGRRLLLGRRMRTQLGRNGGRFASRRAAARFLLLFLLLLLGFRGLRRWKWFLLLLLLEAVRFGWR